MFAFSLALCIVSVLFMKYFTGFEGFRLIVLECSATVCLTCTILYIFDFVNEIKDRINRPKVYSQSTKVTIGIPEKH